VTPKSCTRGIAGSEGGAGLTAAFGGVEGVLAAEGLAVAGLAAAGAGAVCAAEFTTASRQTVASNQANCAHLLRTDIGPLAGLIPVQKNFSGWMGAPNRDFGWLRFPGPLGNVEPSVVPFRSLALPVNCR